MLGRLLKLEERIVLDAVIHTDSADSNSSTEAKAETQQQDTAAADSAENANDPSAPDNTDQDTEAGSAGESVKDSASGSALNTASHSLLLVNSDIEDYQKLVDASLESVVTVVYDADTDDLQSIINQIQQLDDTVYDSIAIASHSDTDGNILLTNSEHVSADSLQTDSDQQHFFASLGDFISADGRLDLLSCFSAAGEQGQRLIDNLESITGHDVAGSDDATGSAENGGDWILESNNIDAKSIYFDSTEITYFTSTLAGTETPSNIVTTTIDLVDDTDGEISLREALMYINDANSDADPSNDLSTTITFNFTVKESSGKYTILLGDSTGDGTVDNADLVGSGYTSGQKPELEINTDVTINGDIDGDGNYDVTIDGGVEWSDTDSDGILDIDETGSASGTRLFYVNDSTDTITVEFTGLKLVNGFSDVSVDDQGHGAAIYNDGEVVTIDNCVFENNVSTSDGGAVYNKYVSTGSLTVKDSTFANNSSVSYGGAIGNTGVGAAATIQNCIFNNNTAYVNGGAIYSDASTGLSITDSFFNYNTTSSTSGQGGAVYANATNLDLSNTMFSNNSSGIGGALYIDSMGYTKNFSGLTFQDNSASTYGGALYLYGTSNLSLTGALFDGNTATQYGGAIKSIDSNLTINTSEFKSNSVSDADGGAIFFESTTAGALVINGGSLHDNSTTSTIAGYGKGGAIYSATSSITLNGVSMYNNTATGSGAALYSSFTGQTVMILASNIYSNSSSKSGGALYIENGSTTIQGSTFSGNSASAGTGGIYIQNNTNVNIIASTIKNNTGNAASGGGISLVNNTSLTNAFINKSVIADNTNSNGSGGGIDLLASSGNIYITINCSSIYGNNAMYGNGGGLYVNGALASVTLINTNISGNTAENGAGIYINSGKVQGVYTTIAYNTASISGGGVYSNSGTVDFLSSIVAANSVNDLAGSSMNFHYSWIGTDLSGSITDGLNGNVLDNSATSLATLGSLAGTIPYLTVSASSPANAGAAVYYYNVGADAFFDTATDYFYFYNGADYVDMASNVVSSVSTEVIAKDIIGSARSIEKPFMGAFEYIPPVAQEAAPIIEDVLTHIPGDSTLPPPPLPPESGDAPTLSDLANDLLLALLSVDDTALDLEGQNLQALAEAGNEGDAPAPATPGEPAPGQQQGQPQQNNGERTPDNGAQNNAAARNTLAGNLKSFNNSIYNNTIVGAGFIIKVSIEGSFATFKILSDNTANSNISQLGSQAASQTIILSVLSLNTDQTLSSINNLLKDIDQRQNPSQAEYYTNEGNGFTAAAADLSDILKSTQKQLIKARARALEANDLLRILSLSITDFSDRIAENSFASGLNKFVRANEELTVEYEVSNNLMKYIKDKTNMGVEVTAVELEKIIPAIRQDALGRAHLITQRSDRAGEEVLEALTRRLQNASAENSSNIEGQIVTMLSSWRSQLGLSPVVSIAATDTQLSAIH